MTWCYSAATEITLKQPSPFFSVPTADSLAGTLSGQTLWVFSLSPLLMTNTLWACHYHHSIFACCNMYECVLWECPAYKDSREEFIIKLRSTLGEAFKDFEALERASFVLGCELWTENFNSMLALVKEYIIDLWEARKVKLYGEPYSTQPQSQSSAGDLRDGTVVGGQRRGKFGKFSHSGRVTGELSTCITDASCKTGSAYTTRGQWQDC